MSRRLFSAAFRLKSCSLRPAAIVSILTGSNNKLAQIKIANYSTTEAGTTHDDHPARTVEELKHKAAKRLANHDTADACGEIYKASTLSLEEYVQKLESVSSKLAVPPKDSWNDELYDDLCDLLKRKAADKKQKLELAHGWVTALVFQARGWQENVLDVEEVSRDMPYVLRFIEIIQNELPVSEEMAAYVGKKLFTKSFADQAAQKSPKDYIEYEVEDLRERSAKYLAECPSDTAQACEKIFQACKLALRKYVEALEKIGGRDIVPKDTDPWNYKTYDKLCLLVQQKVTEQQKIEMNSGWETAHNFHVKGWSQNALDFQTVSKKMPFVLRFLDVVENELPVTNEMATHIGQRLFNFKPESVAKSINEELELGRTDAFFGALVRREVHLRAIDKAYSNQYGVNLLDEYETRGRVVIQKKLGG